MSHPEDDWHWIKAGSNPVYVAVIGGRVEAVVYWTAGEAGTDEAGEPVATAPGWVWLPADRSDLHEELELGEYPGSDETTLDPADDAALEAAADAIRAYRQSSG